MSMDQTNGQIPQANTPPIESKKPVSKNLIYGAGGVILILLLLTFGLFMHMQKQSNSKAPSANVPANTTQNNPVNSPSTTSAASTDNSDSQLNKDSANINSQLNQLNNDQNVSGQDVNSYSKDTPQE